jgi:hypothetical protein
MSSIISMGALLFLFIPDDPRNASMVLQFHDEPRAAQLDVSWFQGQSSRTHMLQGAGSVIEPRLPKLPPGAFAEVDGDGLRVSVTDAGAWSSWMPAPTNPPSLSGGASNSLVVHMSTIVLDAPAEARVAGAHGTTHGVGMWTKPGGWLSMRLRQGSRPTAAQVFHGLVKGAPGCSLSSMQQPSFAVPAIDWRRSRWHVRRAAAGVWSADRDTGQQRDRTLVTAAP